MECLAAVSSLSLDAYQIRGLDEVLTPALAIYADMVDANVRAILRVLGGDANRWRPHVKTAKLGFIMRRLVEAGVVNFKCATTLELLTACGAGARDVLVAYPMQGANAARVKEIARQFPSARVSALVEAAAGVAIWAGSTVSLFVDVNPGMNRTGVAPDRTEEVLGVVRAIRGAGLEFRGLHYYDGQLRQENLAERTAAAHRGYDQLMSLVAALEAGGVAIPEMVTAGTPTLPCSLAYAGFRSERFMHRVSPGTVVYGDATSLAQPPAEYGLRPAVMVVSRVVSHPAPNIVTCDAGHKSVSADAGVPTCVVLGRPELTPLQPSEEHLPLEVPPGAAVPAIGEFLCLLPRHVCPTVNNFDDALIVRHGTVERVERVTARGRETPLVLASVAH